MSSLCRETLVETPVGSVREEGRRGEGRRGGGEREEGKEEKKFKKCQLTCCTLYSHMAQFHLPTHINSLPSPNSLHQSLLLPPSLTFSCVSWWQHQGPQSPSSTCSPEEQQISPGSLSPKWKLSDSQMPRSVYEQYHQRNARNVLDHVNEHTVQ